MQLQTKFVVVSHTQKEIAIKGMCFVRVTQISKAHDVSRNLMKYKMRR